MFTIDHNISNLELKEKNLAKVIFSMNNHQVATPEMSLEEARSYVFIFREGKKRLSAYIGLHFLVTDRKLFYSHSENPFLDDELEDIEVEARNFAEDMGAMLDELDFTSKSEADQNSWMSEQGIFSQKPAPEPEAQKTSVPDPQVAVVAPAPVQAPVAPVPVQLAPQAVPAAPAPVQAPVAPAPVQQAPQAVPVAPAPVQAPVAPTPVQQAPQAVPVAPASVEVTVAPVPVQQASPVAPGAPVPVPQPQQAAPAENPLAAEARKREEIMQKAIKAGIAKPPKASKKREAPSATSVVSRDREAIARLLTSF